MFSSTTQGTPEHPVLRFEGSLTLENSVQIHAAISARLAEAAPFSLDLRGADKFDLSFIQMLYALLKDPGRDIGFLPLPDAFLQCASGLGADSLIKEMTMRIKEDV
jgi:anti-anti-sigma regulatory factor